MRCRKPLKAWKGQAVNPETGKRSLAFKMTEGFYDLPLELGCGQCIPCRLRWSRSWAARADAEARVTVLPCYTVTLTYDEEHLPWGGGSRSTLCLRDVQTFHKRVRFAVGPFRHLTAGEYGDRTQRAHYHSVMFGVALPDVKPWKESRSGLRMFRSSMLEKLWGHGLVSLQPFSLDGAEYVAKYVLKAVKGQAADAAYSDREAPFFIMSRRPGLGAEAYEKFKEEWSLTGEMGISTRKGSEVIPLPAFYMARIREDFPERYEVLRARRAVLARESALCEAPHAEENLMANLARSVRDGA